MYQAHQRVVLHEKIQTWEDIWGVYMPGLCQHLSNALGKEEDMHPEEVRLWLPSALTPSQAALVCVLGLAEIEDKLRTAQCHDALKYLHQILRVKTCMVQFKNKNVQGQRKGLRSSTAISHINLKACHLVGKYCRACAAKVALVGEGRWGEVLRPLNDGDVCAYMDPNRRKTQVG